MRFGSGPTACWGASRTPTNEAKQQEDDLEAIDQAPLNELQRGDVGPDGVKFETAQTGIVPALTARFIALCEH